MNTFFRNRIVIRTSNSSPAPLANKPQQQEVEEASRTGDTPSVKPRKKKVGRSGCPSAGDTLVKDNKRSRDSSTANYYQEAAKESNVLEAGDLRKRDSAAVSVGPRASRKSSCNNLFVGSASSVRVVSPEKAIGSIIRNQNLASAATPSQDPDNQACHSKTELTKTNDSASVRRANRPREGEEHKQQQKATVVCSSRQPNYFDGNSCHPPSSSFFPAGQNTEAHSSPVFGSPPPPPLSSDQQHHIITEQQEDCVLEVVRALRTLPISVEYHKQAIIDAESSTSPLQVKLRKVPGRSSIRKKKECPDAPLDFYYKGLLAIIRSDMVGGDKLIAIKKSRDERLVWSGFGKSCREDMMTTNVEQQQKNQSTRHSGDSNNGSSCMRTKEWVDSGYMSNSDMPPRQDSLESVFNETLSSSTGEGLQIVEQPSRQCPPIGEHSDELGLRRKNFSLRNKYTSFDSDTTTTNASFEGISSILEQRRENPEELLMALGFGYMREEKRLDRIPSRFLTGPSEAKGIDIQEFVRSHHHTNGSDAQNMDWDEACDDKLAILDRFVKTMGSDRNNNTSTEDIVELRRRISVKEPPLAQLRRSSLLNFNDSILNPVNREFLDNQGKDEEENGSKKLVLGCKTYSFVDGDPLVPAKSPIPSPKFPRHVENVSSLLLGAAQTLSTNPNYNGNLTDCCVSRVRKDCSEVGARDAANCTCGADQASNYNLSEKLSLSHSPSSSSNLSSTLASTIIKVTNSEGVEEAATTVCSECACDERKKGKNCDSQTTSPLLGSPTEYELINELIALEETRKSSSEETSEVNRNLIEVAINSLRFSLQVYKHHSLQLRFCDWNSPWKGDVYDKIHDKLNSIMFTLESSFSAATTELTDASVQQLLRVNELVRSATEDLLKQRTRANSMPSLRQVFR